MMKSQYSLLGASAVLMAALLAGCSNNDDAGDSANTGGTTAMGNAGSPNTGTAGTASPPPTQGAAGAASGAAGSAGADDGAATGGAASDDPPANDGNVPVLDAGMLTNPDACPTLAPTDGDSCEAPAGVLICTYDEGNCFCGAGGGGGGMLGGAMVDAGTPTWNCGMFGPGFMGGGMMPPAAM